MNSDLTSSTDIEQTLDINYANSNSVTTLASHTAGVNMTTKTEMRFRTATDLRSFAHVALLHGYDSNYCHR